MTLTKNDRRELEMFADYLRHVTLPHDGSEETRNKVLGWCDADPEFRRDWLGMPWDWGMATVKDPDHA